MKKRGISLIVLIITIIVVIILAATIVIKIVDMADAAKKGKFFNDITAVQDAVNLKYAEYLVDNPYEKQFFNEDIIPNLGKMSAKEKSYANANIPTLNETIVRINNKTLVEANMYILDTESLNVNVKDNSRYLIDMDTRKVYDWDGKEFYKERWHAIEFGIKKEKENEKEAPEGYMYIYLTYPEHSINRQYMIKNGEEQGEWIDYTGKILIKISDRNNIYIRYEDENGEIKTVAPLGSANLLINFSPEYAGKKVEKVTVNIEYDKDAVKKEYKIGTGKWLEYTGEFVITENCTIYAREDTEKEILDEDGISIGETATVSSKIYRNLTYIGKDIEPEIDENLVAPTLVKKDAIESNEVARVEVKYPDLEGITKKVYKINSGEEIEYNGDIKVEKWGSSVTAYYYMDNKKSNIGKINIIDESAKLELKIYLNPEVISNEGISETEVEIEYDERAIGKLYKKDNGQYEEYKEKFVVNDDVEITAKAQASNDSKSTEISRKIKFNHKPEITSFMTSTNSAKVIIRFSDLSTKREYKIGNGEWIEYTGESNILELDLTESKMIYAKNIVYEKERENSKYVIAKVSKDEIGGGEVTEGGDLPGGEETNGDIKISHTVINNKREAKVSITYSQNQTEKMYRIDSGNWQEYTGEFTVSNNCTIYAKSKEVSEKSYKINDINELSIYATHSLIEDGTKAKVAINFEGEGDIKQYSIDGGSLEEYTGEFIVSNNCIIYAFTQDLISGTIKDLTYTIDDISLKKPIISYELIDQNQAAKVSIEYDLQATKKEYKVGSGDWKEYNGEFEVDNNFEIIARNSSDKKLERYSEICTIEGIESLTAPVISISKNNGKATITIEYSNLSVENKYFISDGKSNISYEYTEPFEVNKNCYIIAVSVGKKGETITTTEYVNIDVNTDENPEIIDDNSQTLAPIITNTKGGEKSKVSIKYDDKAITRKYSINGGELQDYVSSFEISENYTVIYAIGYDKNGKPLDNTYTVTGIIKKLSVEIIPDTTELAQEVNVTINYDSDATVREYTLNGKDMYEYTGNIKVTEKVIIKAIAKMYDDYGELVGYGEVSKQITNLPTGLAKPLITATKQISKSQTSEGNIKVETYYKITIQYDQTATNNYYQINSTSEMNYSGEFNVNLKDGDVTIYAWSKDSLSNTSEKATLTLTGENGILDGTIISKDNYYLLTLNYPENSSNRCYKYQESGIWKKYNDIAIALIPSDYEDEIVKNGNVYLDVNGEIVDFTQHYYIITNSIEEEIGNIFVKWDSPVSKTALQIKPLQTEKVPKVEVLLLYPDTIKNVEYSLDGGKTWIKYERKIDITVNNTVVQARMQYSDGTWSDIVEKKITNVYVEPPEVSNIILEKVTTSSITVKPEIMVTESEVANYYYRISGNGIENPEWVKTKNDKWTFNNLKEGTNYTVEIYVDNLTANTSKVYSKSILTLILKEPLISGEATTTSWKKPPKKLTITYVDADKLIKEFSVDNSIWTEIEENEIEFDVNSDTVIYARVKDEDGNVKVASKELEKFDGVAPIIDSISVSENDIKASSFSATIISTDTQSGVKKYIYSTDDFVTYKTCTIDKEKDKVRCEGLAANTEYTIKIKAIDAVGNESEPSAGINITTNEVPAPTIEINGTGYEFEGEMWYPYGTKIIIKYADNMTNLTGYWSYKNVYDTNSSSGSMPNSSYTFTLTASSTWTVYLMDITGQTSEEVTKKINIMPSVNELYYYSPSYVIVGNKYPVLLTGRTMQYYEPYGTDVYSAVASEFSNVDIAAVHAGLVESGETKLLAIEIVECPEEGYVGSTRNGVTTKTTGYNKSLYGFQFISTDGTALKGPTIDSLAISSGTNDITVTANAVAYNGAGIKKYYYSIDGGSYVESNTIYYTFENLTPYVNHTIKVKVEDTNGQMSAESSITGKTSKEIPTPTIEVNGTGYEFEGEMWYPYNTKITIKYADNMKNLTGYWSYKNVYDAKSSSGSMTNSSHKFTLTASSTWTAYIKDITGKTSEIITKTINIMPSVNELYYYSPSYVIVGNKYPVLLTGRTMQYYEPYGTDVYSAVASEFSNVDIAAVHAGLVESGETKLLAIEIVECPEEGYVGSTRNGVTTKTTGYNYNAKGFKFYKPEIESINQVSYEDKLTVSLDVKSDAKIAKYYYKINDEEYVESASSTYTFTGIQPENVWKIQAYVKDVNGIDSSVEILRISNGSKKLYELGNEFVDITGGWDISSSQSYSGASINEDSMQLYYTSDDSNVGCIKTTNKINLTPYNKIYVLANCESYHCSTYGGGFGLFTSSQKLVGETIKQFAANGEDTLYEIDISSIEGEYLLGIWRMSTNSYL